MASRLFFGSYGEPIVVHGSAATNPTSGTSLVTTGALTYGGTYWFLVHISYDGSTGQTFDVLHRNAADSGTTAAMIVNQLGESTGQYDIVFKDVQPGDIVRVEAGANATGEVQVSLMGARIP